MNDHIVDDQRRRRRRLVLGAVAASVLGFLLLIVGAYAYEATLVPSPYDLTVRGSQQFVADSDASLRVSVIRHDDGQGMQNVPVQVELGDDGREETSFSKFTQLVSFETDAGGSGQPRFHLPDWTDGECHLRITAKPPNGAPQTITQTIYLKHSWKLMLSSDRPIYKPGQVIHLRSLALRSLDLKPIALKDVVFTVIDPKDNVIFKCADRTSNYGISSADCVLADEILEGPYTVQCQVGDTTSSLKVTVAKYVLPEFQVAVEFTRPWFRPGERIEGKVRASYFHGKPVTEGLVEIEASPGWPHHNAAESQSVKIGPDGGASFSFPPVEDSRLSGPDAQFTSEVKVKVTDGAGQSEYRKLPLTVTARPLRIEAIPEAGTLIRGVPNTVFVLVTSVDGKPAAKVRLDIFGQDKQLVTNDLGFAQFECTPTQPKVNCTIQASSADGQTGRRSLNLACTDQFDDFILRTDRAVYRGGDTIALQAVGGNTPVVVDLLKDGQTLATQSIPLAGGKGEAKLTIPPEVFGVVHLSAYRDTNTNQPGAQATARPQLRLLYIHPPDQIHIATEMNEKEFKPRGRANLQFTLTDRQGQPAPGALSLAVVDEKVFHVLQQPPGSETSFFTWNPDVLQPVSTAASWSPGATPRAATEEQRLFERAVFARPSASAVPAARDARFDLSTRPANVAQVEETKDAFRAAMNDFWYYFAWVIGIVAVGGFLYVIGKSLVKLKAQSGIIGLVFPTVTVFLLMVFVGIVSISSLGTNANKTFTNVSNTLANVGVGPMEEKSPAAADAKKDDFRVMGGTKPLDNPTAPPRLRDWFPETLLWRPELITDNQGKAPLSFDLADSITTWRLTASAVTANGRLGASTEAITVFQPFFVDPILPVAMTRLDEVSVPVKVANYLQKPQDVVVTLKDADWFDRLEDSAEKRLTLKPGELRATSFRLRLKKAGDRQKLQVAATAGGAADAVERTIDVVPDGRPVVKVWNGSVGQLVEHEFKVPANATEGSPRLFLKVYPSPLSQVLEGLDAIFQLPYGCFEQASSSTYPNVLALDYMRRTGAGKRLPKVGDTDMEEKARGYINAGYQRLISFEVKGGGFDWFGHAPANRTLTAYGLMEFEDMARVHKVDPNVITRTRNWLLNQQHGDGSWDPEGHAPQGLPGQGENQSRLRATAYIAWAVFGTNSGKMEQGTGNGELPEAEATRNFLLNHPAVIIDDPYVLALVANALLAMDGNSFNAMPYLDRLQRLKKTDGKFDFWEQRANDRTAFYGGGESGQVETTALAALALIQANRLPSAVGALNWLTLQRDARGTWHSTQATVLALKALLAGADAPSTRAVERRVQITINDKELDPLVIAADQAEVMAQKSLTQYLRPGANRVTIADASGSRPGYQLVFRCNVPETDRQEKEPFSVKVDFDKKPLKVEELLKVAATVRNEGPATAPMVMVELPIPPGFNVRLDDLAVLARTERIAKFQTRAGQIIVYLRDLKPGEPLRLPYALQATMPLNVHVPAARVYEYYNPAHSGTGRTANLVVTAANGGG